eukprot:TCONS_00018616-protein
MLRRKFFSRIHDGREESVHFGKFKMMNYCILVSTFLSIKTISSSYIASEKGSIAKENLYLLKGVSSPVQCTLRCNQKNEAAFYGADGICGCFSREDLSSDSQTEISGYNYFEIKHTKAL